VKAVRNLVDAQKNVKSALILAKAEFELLKKAKGKH
jgi:hypothetical protein